MITGLLKSLKYAKAKKRIKSSNQSIEEMVKGSINNAELATKCGERTIDYLWNGDAETKTIEELEEMLKRLKFAQAFVEAAIEEAESSRSRGNSVQRRV